MRKSPINARTVIIGGGIGGLSAGIILAGLGHSVTLVEKNSQVGGMMRSYSRQGIDCDIGIQYLGALDRGQVLRRCLGYLKVSADIPLRRMGKGGIVDRYQFTNPSGGPSFFDLPVDINAYQENLKSAFPGENEAIDAFMVLLRRSSQQLNDLAFLYQDLPSETLIDQAEPLGRVLKQLGCSPQLRRVIGVPAYWLGAPAERCPLFFHNMTLANYLFSSWRLAQSGTHMANAFSDRLRALGGKIIPGRMVERIIVKKGRLAAVLLDNQDTISASTVIATVHPKVVLKLLQATDLKPSYRDRINRLRDTRGFCCVHAKVKSNGTQPLPYNLFQIEEGGKTLFIQLRKTPFPKWHRLTILGSGQSNLWAPWKQTTTGRRGNRYLEMKHQVAEEMIARVKALIGPFPGLDILDIYTPLTIRDWVNSPAGSAYGVMKSSDQLFSADLLNRTGIDGLFLAGQSSLAPGILGTILGSFATVKSILGAERFKQLIQL